MLYCEPFFSVHSFTYVRAIWRVAETSRHVYCVWYCVYDVRFRLWLLLPPPNLLWRTHCVLVSSPVIAHCMLNADRICLTPYTLSFVAVRIAFADNNVLMCLPYLCLPLKPGQDLVQVLVCAQLWCRQ